MTSQQQRENPVQCALCPSNHTTFNTSALCDKHEAYVEEMKLGRQKVDA